MRAILVRKWLEIVSWDHYSHVTPACASTFCSARYQRRAISLISIAAHGGVMTVFLSHLYCLLESRQNARIAENRSLFSAPSCHILPPIHRMPIFMKKHSPFTFLLPFSYFATPHAVYLNPWIIVLLLRH
jgi:hypothetical protein